MTTIFSGATVGVMKNTVDVQSVSTMPAEEVKVGLGQKSNVVIYLKIYLIIYMLKKSLKVFWAFKHL